MDGLVGSPRCLLLFGLSMEVTMSGCLVVAMDGDRSRWGPHHDRHGQVHCPYITGPVAKVITNTRANVNVRDKYKYIIRGLSFFPPQTTPLLVPRHPS